MQLEIELNLREEIARRQSEKKLDIYRGTPKLWQVVDHGLYGKEEAKKIQQAIGAPVPEQLDHWEKTTKAPIPLPMNNEKMSKWRDQRRITFSASFDPKNLQEERKREMRLLYEKMDKITNQN